MQRDPEQTISVRRVFRNASQQVSFRDSNELKGQDVLVELMREEESYAVYLMKEQKTLRQGGPH